SALQELKVYVAGTLRLTTTAIDDTWQGGHVGVWRASASTTTTLQWDNFKCGRDRSSPLDGDVDDAGDAVYADYNFNDPGGSTWQTIALSHDDAGNLTGDGLFQYKYDAWNRLVEVFYAGGDASDSTERVALYAYDGLSRRVTKDVAHQGVGFVHGSDAGGATGVLAGDRSEQFYYAGWRVVELCDKATPAATLGQFV
ncbi:MAG: hypothetical protein JNG88_18310, partial [Phycisphaerales bacterium]|nr:hypothetical protein [Phycisphaerales bacterium]